MKPASLFHDSLNEALREVALVVGSGKLKVPGAALRPDLSPEDAGKWLSDCLNPDRSQELKPGQVMWLLRQGREHGCHAAANFLMRECGYADPVPVEPEDEIARAQREFTTAVAALPVLVDRLARLGVKVAA